MSTCSSYVYLDAPSPILSPILGATVITRPSLGLLGENRERAEFVRSDAWNVLLLEYKKFNAPCDMEYWQNNLNSMKWSEVEIIRLGLVGATLNSLALMFSLSGLALVFAGVKVSGNVKCACVLRCFCKIKKILTTTRHIQKRCPLCASP